MIHRYGRDPYCRQRSDPMAAFGVSVCSSFQNAPYRLFVEWNNKNVLDKRRYI
jgi:hypothetical protein